jgi:hypothetical protein
MTYYYYGHPTAVGHLNQVLSQRVFIFLMPFLPNSRKMRTKYTKVFSHITDKENVLKFTE